MNAGKNEMEEKLWGRYEGRVDGQSTLDTECMYMKIIMRAFLEEWKITGIAS